MTKPFQFEGQRRMRVAESGINELQKAVDTLIVIPNQNLFRVANEKTTFADAFSMADQVLYSGVACITDLMVKEGLINLDFADVRAIMREMGKAMMGTGEASGDKRAIMAAEAAIANPLLDEVSMRGAKGLLISITGGNDLTLYEVDEAASRIRQEVDDDANIILGATFEPSLDGIVRVSVVATGIDHIVGSKELTASENRIAEVATRLGQQRASLQQLEARPGLGDAHADASHYAEAPAALTHAFQPASLPARSAPQQPLPADVEIHQIQPKAATFTPPAAASPAPARHDYAEPSHYIPPAPALPQRPQRMPQVEDLPIPVQNQLRAHRGEPAPEGTPMESKRRTLLERLASFGMSRHDDAADASKATGVRPPAAQPAPVQAAMPRPAPTPTHAEYAKRPAPTPPRQAPVDQHGRQVPPQRSHEEDQLEIPAFLRRQSN